MASSQVPQVPQGSPSAPAPAPNGQATYTADGYGQAGFGAPGTRQDGYPPDPYAQDQYAAQDQYPQDQYAAQDQYPQDQYAAQDQYPQDQYAAQDHYAQDQYPQDPYIQDPYGQVATASRASSSRRGPVTTMTKPRAAGGGRARARRVLASGRRSDSPGRGWSCTWPAAVIGVVVIVLLVIHLTKSGANNAASGSVHAEYRRHHGRRPGCD